MTSQMSREIRLEHPVPCKVKGCGKQTKLKNHLCGKHDSARKRYGSPIHPAVNLFIGKHLKLVKWVVADIQQRREAGEPEALLAVQNVRSALVKYGSNPSSPHREFVFGAVENSSEEHRQLILARAVVLTAVAIYHDDVLPTGVPYIRQMGRSFVRVDRSMDMSQMFGMRFLDALGNLMVSTQSTFLQQQAKKLVEECPDWWE